MSRNPKTVITSNGSANERGSKSVSLQSWKIRDSTNPRGYASSSIPMSRQVVKNHTLSKTAENAIQHGKLRADRFPKIINGFHQFDFKHISNIVTAGLNSRRLYAKFSNYTTSRYTQSSIGRQSHNSEKSEDENKDIDLVLGNRLQDLSERLEDFTENLADERLSASRDTPTSIFLESNHEPPRKVVSSKHSTFTHFPKDQNCEICKRTKITRALCKKRTGNTVLRAAFFGDLIKADHKVLSEECESRNNNRYAVVVQDLATQWLQSYPCETQSYLKTEKRVYEKFLEPSIKPRVIHTDNSLEFGKPCEEYPRIIEHPRQNGITERAVRRINEGTSAVLLQSGMDEVWWADSMECYCYLRSVQDLGE